MVTPDIQNRSALASFTSKLSFTRAILGPALIALFTCLSSSLSQAAQAVSVKQWSVYEKTLTSSTSYTNIQKYRDVSIAATFTGPDGSSYKVPGFWDGDSTWRIRFAPPLAGTWTYTVTSSDTELASASNGGSFTAEPLTDAEISANPNNRGFVRVSDNGRHFVYADGTPFFWMGGTIWRGNSYKMSFTDSNTSDFKKYVDDRRAKNFTAIQIKLANPENSHIYRDERAYNENGPIFNREFSEINPAHFRNLDQRLQYVLDRGMIPVIFMNWGDTYNAANDAALQSYAWYIVARYQAYNVIWTISGEYMENAGDVTSRLNSIRAVSKSIEMADAYKHPTTVHPGPNAGTGGNLSSSQHFGSSDSWLDFHMQQTWEANERNWIINDYKLNQGPVVNAEFGYEGMWNHDRTRIRREAWEVLMAGGAGVSYGAAGLWRWDNPDDLNLEGSNDMKRIVDFFAGIDWHLMLPDHAASVSVSNGRYLVNETDSEYIVYLPSGGSTTISTLPAEPVAQWYNPATGSYQNAGSGSTFTAPSSSDWVLHVQPGLDNTPPSIESVSASSLTDQVTVFFNEALDPASAGTAENFAVDNNAIVANASLLDGNTVVLDVTGLKAGITYTLTVSSVADLAGNVIESGTSVTFSIVAPDSATALIAYWPFDEGSGKTVFDASGSGHDGTIQSATWSTGKSGSALHFDGKNNHVSIAHSDTLNVKQLTISTWIKIDDANLSRHMRIVSKKKVWDAPSGYELQYNPGRNYLSVVGSGTSVVGTTVELSTGWHHVAAVVDGSSARLYVDGKDVTVNSAFSNLTANSEPLTIGKQSGGTDYFHGSIDEVRLYNRALTATDIEYIYTNPDSYNQAPIAVDDVATTLQNTPVLIDVLANDSDPDGDPLQILSVGIPAHGTAVIKDNHIEYEPEIDYYGTDSFIYTITDGKGGTATANVNITIELVNQAPVADDLALNTMINQAVDGTLTATDRENDPLTFTITSTAELGEVELLDAVSSQFRYTPAPDVTGSDSFTFSVSDGEAQDSGTVTVLIEPETDLTPGLVGYWTFDENSGSTLADLSDNGNSGTIHGPTWSTGRFGSALAFDGIDDHVVVPDSNSLTVTDALTISAWIKINDTDLARHMRIVSKKRVWDSAAGYELQYNPGRDYLSVVGAGSSRVGTTVKLSAGWHHVAAVVNGSSARLYVDGVDVTTDSAIASLTAGTEALTIGKQSGGTDYFYGSIDEVRIYDRALAAEDIATLVTFTPAEPVNTAPVAQDFSIETTQNKAVEGFLQATDADGDALVYAIAAQPSIGTVELLDAATGNFRYTPDADVTGSDSFTYNAADGTDVSNTATVNVTVAEGSRSAPVTDAVAHWNFDENSGSTVADLSEYNNTGTIHGATWTTGRFGSALAFDGISDHVVVPDSNSLTVTDALTISAWIKINDTDLARHMRIVSKKRVWDSAAGYELQYNPGRDYLSVVGSGSDRVGTSVALDTGWHHVAAVVDGSSARLYVNGADVTGNSAFSPLTAGTDALTIGKQSGGTDYFYGSIDEVQIYDRALTAVEISSLHNPDGTTIPSISAVDDTAEVDEDQSVDIAVLANDSGEGLIITDVTTPTSGAAVINETIITYTPIPDFNGSDSFTYTITDIIGATATATVSVTVHPVNDAPLAHDMSITVTAGATVEGRLSATDVDGDALTYALLSTGTLGTAQLLDAATGAFSYTADSGVEGIDSFTFIANDGIVDSNTGTVTVTVTAEPNAEPEPEPEPGADPDLMAHWTFDETDGNSVADISGNGNHGVVNGATFVEGRIGNALSFNGSGDFVRVSSSDSLNTGSQLTMAAWIKFTDISNWTHMRIISKKTTWDAIEGYEMQFNPPRGYMSVLTSGTGIAKAEGLTTDNNWRFVTAVIDGSSARLYVDGRDVTTDPSVVPLVDGNTDLFIGSQNGAMDFFQGLIDDVRLYSRALTAAEVTGLYEEIMGQTPHVNIAWDASTDPDVAGYRLHYGSASGSYDTVVDVGNKTSHTVYALAEGVPYYFAATAYYSNGVESELSNEISYTATSSGTITAGSTENETTLTTSDTDSTTSSTTDDSTISSSSTDTTTTESVTDTSTTDDETVDSTLLSPVNWSLPILIEGADSAGITVAMDAAAADAEDDLDQAASIISDTLDIVVEGLGDQGDLRADYRPLDKVRANWFVRVVNKTGASTFLNWKATSTPLYASLTIAQIDANAALVPGTEVDMTLNNMYEVKAAEAPVYLRISYVSQVESEATVALAAGWNLVSFNLSGTDNSTANIFKAVEIDSILAYDAFSGEYQVPTVIEPGRGYWVSTAAPAAVTYRGTPAVAGTVELQAGWNLIAPIADTPVPVNNAIISVYSWNAETRKYESGVTNLTAGKAYWFYATAKTALQLK